MPWTEVDVGNFVVLHCLKLFLSVDMLKGEEVKAISLRSEIVYVMVIPIILHYYIRMYKNIDDKRSDFDIL